VPGYTFPSNSRVLKAVLLGAGLVLLTIAGVRLTDRADARSAVRQSLRDAERFDDSLRTASVRASSARISFPGAIALSYLARADVGLGSPFRLITLARTDPRLPIAMRSRVGYAVLARLLADRRVMRPLPDALDAALPSGSRAGRSLLRVVDSVAADGGDSPLMLEAVRIAAAQASARGALRPGAVALLDAASLLAFDRVRARRDAERVVAAAARDDGDALRIVAQWRTLRQFAVERPLLADVAVSSRRIAARVPALVRAIEAAAAATDTGTFAPQVAPLSVSAANALSLLISVRTRPVQPQVQLGVLDTRVVVADRRRVETPRATRLLQSATNEETLVLALAFAGADTLLSPLTSAAALLASQGMRTLSQEVPFHPGTLDLEPAQVVERFGLASLTFGSDVPESWRPFYAREFATAVDALRDVFPRASFAGLRVRIGDRVKAGALAVHDPRTRTLTLPLATGFGAIGHELMHDLDWQTARDYAGREGTYATDNAWRRERTAPIAAPLARLAEFVPVTGFSAAYEKEARRPAELLARGADWYVASALARQGRSNGALSSVQDGWVRGYASAAGPVAFGDHDAALAALLDLMPTLETRVSLVPRNDAEREPDLGSIARAAWFSPVPFVDLSASHGTLALMPTAGGAQCAPLAVLRLAPVRSTARGIAAGFLEPRIDRAMQRWARQVNVGALSPDAAGIRLAILGSPVRPEVTSAARARWSEAVWSALPCLNTERAM
jgi:hypothetical protein